MDKLTRRDAVRVMATVLACPLAAACRGSATEPAPDDDTERAAVISPMTVEIAVAQVAAWREPVITPRVVIFFAAQLVAVRQPDGTFTAFSNVCPHASCGVTIARETRVECPCHGSTFDLQGQRLDGPATRGLQALPATFDASTQRLRVQRPS